MVYWKLAWQTEELDITKYQFPIIFQLLVYENATLVMGYKLCELCNNNDLIKAIIILPLHVIRF